MGLPMNGAWISQKGMGKSGLKYPWLVGVLAVSNGQPFNDLRELIGKWGNLIGGEPKL